MSGSSAASSSDSVVRADHFEVAHLSIGSSPIVVDPIEGAISTPDGAGCALESPHRSHRASFPQGQQRVHALVSCSSFRCTPSRRTKFIAGVGALQRLDRAHAAAAIVALGHDVELLGGQAGGLAEVNVGADGLDHSLQRKQPAIPGVGRHLPQRIDGRGGGGPAGAPLPHHPDHRRELPAESSCGKGFQRTG